MRYALLNAALLAAASSALAALGGVRTTTQDPEEQAREAARVAVQAYSERHQFFSVHRREDLEDIFYSLKTAQDGQDPKIFAVSDEGFEFENNRVKRHLSVHGPFAYLVAVTSQGGNVFRISGFKDSQVELNRLAQVYHLNVATELQAEDYATFYFQLDPSRYRITRASSLLLTKQLAERRFDESYSDFTTAELRFDQWWNHNKDNLSRLSFPDKISPQNRGFEISFLTLSGIEKESAKGPGLLMVTLFVSNDGQVSEPKLAPVGAETRTD